MLLTLSVPAANDRGPLYMEQTLAAIHQANSGRQAFTLILGQHGGHVCLACRCPEELRAVIESQLFAAYPDARIEWLPAEALELPPDSSAWTAELHLHPDLFPIKRYPQFEDALNRVSADPLTAILMTLTIGRNHALRGQVEFTVQPARPARQRRGIRILHRLNAPFFRSHPRLAHLYLSLALSPHWSLRIAGFLLGRLGRGHDQPQRGDPLHTTGGRLHEREEDLQAASDKLGKLLFEAKIHVAVSGPTAGMAKAKLREIAGSFGQFSLPRLATFHPARPRWWFVRRRAPPFLLSTEELATLWHPPTTRVRAPTLAQVESREFAPPVTLPKPDTHPDLAVLGSTLFRGQRQRFGLLPDDRFRHLAILGKTGMGKSTLLRNLVTSDIRAGRGVALIDPHGDLIEAILPAIPKHRTNDVILFDAGDREYPMSYNVLSCGHPEQRPLVASGVVSAFKKLFADSWGPRLEHILRNSLLALLEVPGTTLLSVLQLLSDATYRKAIRNRVSDPVVRSFWEHEFASMHPKLQVEAIAPIQNKVGRFVSSPLLRNIVGQARNSLDLRQVMDQGKILLVNLSKGRIGDDESALLGSFLTTALQLAAMSRADIPESQRRDFYLYVDEFQNFATQSFATIFSEARKYRLALTVANQYLAQLDEATLHALFGNVSTLACFQVGAKDAELLAEQLGGDVTPQDLLRLPHFRAVIQLLIAGMPSRPFSMQTLPPALQPGHFDRLAIIRRTSRQHHAQPLARVEAEIATSFTRG